MLSLGVRIPRPAAAAALLLAAACGEPIATTVVPPGEDLAGVAQAFECRAEVRAGSVACGALAPRGASLAVIGGQGQNVQVTSSNVSVGGGIFQFDVTVQNLLPEAMGTPDGVVPDTAGINVFFASGPRVTSGTGTVTVANADGVRAFTASGQPYFRYPEILPQSAVSSARTWQLAYDPGVETFSFRVYVWAELQPLLIINEVMVNPVPMNDADSEWFEVYNAGRFPVEMQGMVIADSAQIGRRPYHVIGSPLQVPSGGYVVLGNSTNTTVNGGAPVDYAYGGALALANSQDAVKIARVYGPGDTLTIDRTQYASAPISAQPGISRELRNPVLDNSNMDGSNWANAAVTTVYGSGGRGTPKAQNSAFTP